MLTQSERLKICGYCLNRKFNPQTGLVCGLTKEKPNFEDSCPDYQADEEFIKREAEKKAYAQKDNFTGLKDSVEVYQVDKGLRFANYIIDRILLFFLAVVIAIASMIFLGFGYEDEMNPVAERLMDLIFGGIATLIYYPFFEGIFGRTPGKWITNTKVVNNDGSKPNLSTIFLRTLCRFIPFEPFSFLGSEPVGWHDTLSKTRVVKADYDPAIETNIEQFGKPVQEE